MIKKNTLPESFLFEWHMVAVKVRQLISDEIRELCVSKRGRIWVALHSEQNKVIQKKKSRFFRIYECSSLQHMKLRWIPSAAKRTVGDTLVPSALPKQKRCLQSPLQSFSVIPEMMSWVVRWATFHFLSNQYAQLHSLMPSSLWTNNSNYYSYNCYSNNSQYKAIIKYVQLFRFTSYLQDEPDTLPAIAPTLASLGELEIVGTYNFVRFISVYKIVHQSHKHHHRS